MSTASCDNRGENVREAVAPREAVLITGASGYVGRMLVRALAADRRLLKRIVATDIVAPGERLDGVIYTEADIRSPAVGALIAEHRIDTVVHLAAVVTPTADQTPEQQHAIDVIGTRELLRACEAHSVRKLIVTSSGAAYGYHADNARLLDEDSPLRGNSSFAYAHHKRLVEQMLAEARSAHPDLQQLVFRVGTILGSTTTNQITALFDKPVIVGLRGVSTPFVFVWDRDVVACLARGVHGEQVGIYNLAGDGTVSLREIAARLDKPYLPLPSTLVTAALTVLKRCGLTRYGPEQVGFLRHRPVLSNERLKRRFGYRPRPSRQVFEQFQQGHR